MSEVVNRRSQGSLDRVPLTCSAVSLSCSSAGAGAAEPSGAKPFPCRTRVARRPRRCSKRKRGLTRTPSAAAWRPIVPPGSTTRSEVEPRLCASTARLGRTARKSERPDRLPLLGGSREHDQRGQARSSQPPSARRGRAAAIPVVERDLGPRADDGEDALFRMEFAELIKDEEGRLEPARWSPPSSRDTGAPCRARAPRRSAAPAGDRLRDDDAPGSTRTEPRARRGSDLVDLERVSKRSRERRDELHLVQSIATTPRSERRAWPVPAPSARASVPGLRASLPHTLAPAPWRGPTTLVRDAVEARSWRGLRRSSTTSSPRPRRPRASRSAEETTGRRHLRRAGEPSTQTRARRPTRARHYKLVMWSWSSCAAFCAVVERRTAAGGGAAARDPARRGGSVRMSLENELGTQLAWTGSGPPGSSQPRPACGSTSRTQRLLALEDQARAARRRRDGRRSSNRRPRPGRVQPDQQRSGAHSTPLRVPARTPRTYWSSSRSPRRTPSSSRSSRARARARDRRRAPPPPPRLEPGFKKPLLLRPGHPRVRPRGTAGTGRTVTLGELVEENMILMHEDVVGKNDVEDGLQQSSVRLRDLDVRLELGLPGVRPAAGSRTGTR